MKIYRYFECKDHALEMINGRLRFVRTVTFRDHYDQSRADLNEQIYNFRAKNINNTQEIGNQVYSISCSTKLSHHLMEKFGEYVVQINSADEFRERINDSLRCAEVPMLGKLEAASIQYYSVENNTERSFESRLFCKKSHYSDEFEYRFMFIFNDRDQKSPNDHLYFNFDSSGLDIFLL